MTSCVVIHPTGAIDVADFQPALHQRLRGLGYKRFAIQSGRGADGLTHSAAVYARLAPSAWQASEAVRKLWGRGVGEVTIYDEQGELVESELAPNEPKPTPPTRSSAAIARPFSVSIPEDPAIAARARMEAMDADVIEHRLRSLAHRWLYLVDRNDGNAVSFDELFAEEIELAWSPAGIRTHEELGEWYRGVSQRVLKSSHTLSDFRFEQLDEGRYRMRLELQWYGFTRAQPHEEVEARTLHEWTVVDDPSDPFARIEKAKIEILVSAQRRRA